MKAIGIDIGTTSISAMIMDTGTDAVVRSWTIANPGFQESQQPWERVQDAEAVVAAAVKLLDEVLSGASDVGVIGLTGQMHGIVYLDGEGRSLGPLITWQDGRGIQPCFDGRSVCDAVTERFGVKAYAGYGLVSHLYNLHKGIVPKGARSMATIMDYLGMALTGAKRPLLHSSNAASLGFYDLKNHAWRRDIVAAFGENGELLPEITNRYAVIGSYRGIPVSVAVGDNQASFMGSVRQGSEEILVNIGTGGQISALSGGIVDAEDIETRPFNEGSYLVVGSSLCGGRAYATLASFMSSAARAFGVADPNPYAAMAALLEAPQSPDPLRVDTRFAGTREHPDIRGSIANITTDNLTPAELVRGVLGGMADELLTLYRRMEPRLGAGRSRIIASGNGMRRNRALQQITSERFNMPLILSEQTEEAACGAAIVGLCATGERTWEEAVGWRHSK